MRHTKEEKDKTDEKNADLSKKMRKRTIVMKTMLTIVMKTMLTLVTSAIMI